MPWSKTGATRYHAQFGLQRSMFQGAWRRGLVPVATPSPLESYLLILIPYKHREGGGGLIY